MQYDRLSALFQRFSLRVTLCETGQGNMRVLGAIEDGTPTRVIFSPSGRAVAEPVGEKVLIEAEVDWGGAANPLLAALPSTLALPVHDPDTVLLLQVNKLLRHSDAKLTRGEKGAVSVSPPCT